MKNADRPIHPTGYNHSGGLTKREYFAAMAMQGMFSQNGFILKDAAELARISILCADELLKKLE